MNAARSFTAVLFAALIASGLLAAHAAYAATTKTQGQKQPSATAAELQAKYAAYAATGEKIRVLIVPGHEPGYGGAEFDTVKERDLVVPIADALAARLRADPHFDVIETRTASAWTDTFADYFKTQWRNIRSFVSTNKNVVTRAISKGNLDDDEESVGHITADEDVALRLFGITKWADDNGVDLAIHIHLNDAPGHGFYTPGPYAGFALYVPDHQFNNASTSFAVAQRIAARLSAYHATSTLPGEIAGVIPDQGLIAIGADDTASYPSIVAELAYIYEPQFWHPDARALATADYASELYLGVEDFFGQKAALAHGTGILPYPFSGTPALKSNSADAYALQASLRALGYYPPAGASFGDCPVSGLMGPCTVSALKAFQKSQGFEQTGTLGPKTRAALAKLLP